MNKKDNIILIGMPGSGKSSLGVVLAKKMGWNFIDSDVLIQNETGKLLCELIEEHGSEGFVEIENRVNKNINSSKTVIAPGGSIIYCEEAMEHFKEIGTVVYLKLTYEEIEKRLGNLKNRGVVLKDGQTLKDLYNERIVKYEQWADVTVELKGSGIRKSVEEVFRRVSIR